MLDGFVVVLMFMVAGLTAGAAVYNKNNPLVSSINVGMSVVLFGLGVSIAIANWATFLARVLR